MEKKNPHAIALGRKGGAANTVAQAEARARNGRNGGRPSVYRRSAHGHVERLEGETWARVEPLDAAAKAWMRREGAAWEEAAD